MSPAAKIPPGLAVKSERLSVEQIALIYEVPYWLIDGSRGRPSWWRRPIWRARALKWSRRP